MQYAGLVLVVQKCKCEGGLYREIGLGLGMADAVNFLVALDPEWQQHTR